jgi:hypothetical protein
MSLCRLSHAPVVYEELPVRARGTAEQPPRFECDLCGKSFDGRPAGSGLFLWPRGQELRVEQPPLCEECASRVTIGALFQWAQEDDE